jgi:hypothetical protein
VQLRYDASDNAPIVLEELALFEDTTNTSDGASSSNLSNNASTATTPAAKGGTATVHAHDEQQHGSGTNGPEQDRSVRVS